MPRHEWLRHADLRYELGDGGLARREAADDPEPVDVGKGLVNEAQLAQLVRLEDGIGDRAANVGSRGAQKGISGVGRCRINDDLYQWGLILLT
jgi:hypothetical protein